MLNSIIEITEKRGGNCGYLIVNPNGTTCVTREMGMATTLRPAEALLLAVWMRERGDPNNEYTVTPCICPITYLTTHSWISHNTSDRPSFRD